MFDRDNKQMYTADNIIHLTMLSDRFKVYIEEDDERIEIENADLLRPTDQIDKENNPIYEKDILEDPDANPIEKKRGLVLWKREHSAFFLVFEREESLPLNSLTTNHYSIVGNFLLNPGMLKMELR